VAEEVLSKAGFEQVWDLEGHMVAWREAELPVGVAAADCC
jgi:rhodanese-related sulfurtransferase